MQHQFQTSEPAEETSLHIAPPAETSKVETAQTLPDAQTVTDLLTQARQKVRRRNKQFWAALAAILALYATRLLIAYMFDLYADDSAEMIPLVLMCVFGIVALRALSRPTGIDYANLARMSGGQAVPALLEVMRSGIGRDFDGCRSALIVCLPKLQATDAALLTSHDRGQLNEVLRRYCTQPDLQKSHPTFALAILKAYEQVGDARAIPLVSRLASMKPRNLHQQKLQQAARECLPLLRARVSSLEPEQTLLRASAPDTNTPATLLRAVAPAPAAPDDELLRATDRNHNLPSS